MMKKLQILFPILFVLIMVGCETFKEPDNYTQTIGTLYHDAEGE